MGAIAKIAKKAIDTVKDVAKTAVNVVGSGLQVASNLLKGDLKGAADAFKQGCQSVLNCAANVAQAVPGFKPMGIMLGLGAAAAVGGAAVAGAGRLLGGINQALPQLMNALPLPSLMLGNAGGHLAMGFGPQGFAASGGLHAGGMGFGAGMGAGPYGASFQGGGQIGNVAAPVGGVQSQAQAAAGTLSTYLKDSNQSLAGIFGKGAGGKDFMLGREEMMALANNKGGKVPPMVQQAAQFMVQNPAVFEAIDTMNGRMNNGKVSVGALREAAAGFGQGGLLGGGPMVGSGVPQGGYVGGGMAMGGYGGGGMAVGGYGGGGMAVGGYGGGGMAMGGYGGGGMAVGGHLGGGVAMGGYGGGMMPPPPPLPPGGYAGAAGAPGGGPAGNSSAAQVQSIQQGVGGAESATMQSIAAQDRLSALQQWASTQTALMKLRSDLNDAMNNFIKGIGSSVKSASQ